MTAIDVNEQNFITEVLEKSRTVPVVVDFWAPWCGPCRTLKPILEKLAEEFQGKFVLAKVNADENQALAAQFGVRGIPSVKAIYNGKIVNEFSGAIPEADIRNFLDNIIPDESETKRLEALELAESGNVDAALSLLENAVQLDDNNFQAKIDLARLHVNSGNHETANQLLQVIPVNFQQEDQVKELFAKIALADRSSNLPDKNTLQQRIDADENDLQSRVDLADLLVAEQHYDEAMELLFYVIGRDRQFKDEVARKSVLSIFTLLGNQDPRVRAARKRLASLLN